MTPQTSWQSHRGRRRNAPRGRTPDLQIRSLGRTIEIIEVRYRKTIPKTQNRRREGDNRQRRYLS
jgi:hypothetical protein